MNSPGVHLDRIGLVMLGVKDLERAVKFYRDILGMKVSAHVEGFAFLDAGGVTLVLSEPLAKAIGNTGGALELVFTVAVRTGPRISKTPTETTSPSSGRNIRPNEYREC
jgi:catechol 2,3-dioxygenase-like lactoylglutathione lyase family enzyme